jgi:hypothetical protein
LRCAPFTNSFVLDTWRSLPLADCSAFGRSCPAWSADLTRCSTLDAPFRSRIAPLPNRLRSCCARISPRSALEAFAPRTDCSEPDARRLTPGRDFSCPGLSRFAPHPDRSEIGTWRSVTVYGLLPTQSLLALVSCMDCSVLNTSSFAPDTDRSVFDAWRLAQFADFSAPLAVHPVLPAECSVIKRMDPWSTLQSFASNP